MAKETKRYMLVEYAGTRQTVCKTQEEVDAKLEEVRRYNNRKTAKFIFGNIKVQEVPEGFQMTSHFYTKYTNRETITDIDKLTSQLTEKELIAIFADKSRMMDGYAPDVNIAYFETKNEAENKDDPTYVGVKYIPVMYKDDVKYMDENYIRKCLTYHARRGDTGFFKELANEFCMHHVAGEEIERIYMDCDGVEHLGYDPITLYYDGMALYKQIIYERNKDGSMKRSANGGYEVSRRRTRDFGFFVRNYNSEKKKSPLQYNGSTVKMEREAFMTLRSQVLENMLHGMILKYAK